MADPGLIILEGGVDSLVAESWCFYLFSPVCVKQYIPFKEHRWLKQPVLTATVLIHGTKITSSPWV